MPEEFKMIKNADGAVNADGKQLADGNDGNNTINPPKEDEPSAVETVINIIESGGVEVFIDQFNKAYASFNENNEMLNVDASDFRDWVRLEIYKKAKKTFSRDIIDNAVSILGAKAKGKGQTIKLYVRTAKDENGDYWYDLSKNAAIKINKDGWSIVQNPPKIFKKFKTQKPQVTPLSGAVDLSKLISLFNLSNPDDKILLQVYLVSCFIYGFPHPVLIIFGQQGSAKSTLCKFLKSLIDPSSVSTLGPIRNPNDLIQATSHNWATYFDNLSRMDVNLSDALCRICTGDGFVKRELYKNDEDFAYDFQHIVGLNGINNIASKPDLLDRSLLIELSRIPDTMRKLERDVKAEFETIKPYILGVCFDAIVKSINLFPSIKIKEVPRMADFAFWGYAIAEALNIGGENFLQAYNNNITRQNMEAIEASPVAKAIITLMNQKINNIEEGTADYFYGELIRYAQSAEVDYTKDSSWPKNASWFSKKLAESIPNLEKMGIRVSKNRGEKRMIVIEKIKTDSKSNSPLNDDINTSEIPMDDDGLTPAERERKQAYDFNGNDIKNGDDFDVSNIPF